MQSVLGDPYGIDFLIHAENRDIDLLTEYLQLFDRGRTVHVAGGQQRLTPFFLEHERELTGGRRLTGTLQADKHDDRHAVGAQHQLTADAAQKLGQFIANDFDHRLIRLQTAEYFLTHRFGANVGDKIFSDFEIDVRFQEGTSYLTQSRVDIAFGKFSLAAQIRKCLLQLFA